MRKRFKKCSTCSEVLSASSSWMAWPAAGMSTNWNLPCIWPMVNTLSRRSVPASSSILGIERPRNASLRPAYHPCQKAELACKSVRQCQTSPTCEKGSSRCENANATNCLNLHWSVQKRMSRQRQQQGTLVVLPGSI